MSGIASQLEQKIEAVQQERERVALEMRKAAISSRNEKARRLVSRLEDCDESIANLLSQAADCLEALVTFDSRKDTSESEDQARQVFEARAQDWFGSLHDVQMGLRSAVKNLRKAQVPPVAHDASSKRIASSSSLTTGSASRGHSLALHQQRQDAMTPSSSSLLQAFVDVDQGQIAMQSSLTEIGKESKLSLSALRLQESSWKELANSLEDLAVSKQMLTSNDSDLSDGGSSQATVRPPPSPSRKCNKGKKLSLQEMQHLHRGAQGLIYAQASQDARLLNALFQSNGFTA